MRLNIFRSAAALTIVGVLFAAGTLAYLDFSILGSGSEFTTLAQTSENFVLSDEDEDWRDGVTASFYVSNFEPGGTYRGWIGFKNKWSGTINSLLMDWSVTNHGGVETEPETKAEGKSPVNDLSTQIIVDNILYGPQGNLSDITDNIKDNIGVDTLTINTLDQEKIDLEEMLPAEEAGMESREIENLVMEFIFNPEAGNEYQGDNCVADITFSTSSQTPNDPPGAEAGGPYSVNEGNSIELDGTRSDDPEDDELTYSWEITDDPTENASLSESDTSTPLFHAPSVNSNTDIEVELTVRDGHEHSDSDTTIVTVKPISNPPANNPPSADFTYSPSEPEVGENVSFDASDSSDSDGSIDSYEWIFGDGSTGSGVSPTHAYDENGVFEVTLTVIDDDGATDSLSKDVTVVNVSPIADFNYTPTEPTVDRMVTFDGTSSSDNDGTVENYEWDLDGNNQFDDATGSSPSKTFENSDNYRIGLRVTDDDGATNTKFKTIEVSAVIPPTADFNYTPTEPTVYEGISFNASISTDGDNPIDSYLWDFGDGENGSGMIVNHTYDPSDNYDVTLTVVDNEGASDSKTKTVLVQPIPENSVENESVYENLSFEENVPENLKIENTDIVMLRITVGREVENVGVRVQELENMPPGVEVPAPGTNYRAFNFEVTNLEGENAVVRFRVSKAWLNSNNVDENSVHLYRHIPDNDEWVELGTVMENEDGDYVYYSVNLHGFSLFAVSGLERKEAVAEEGFPWAFIGGTIVVLVVIVAVFWYYREKVATSLP